MKRIAVALLAGTLIGSVLTGLTYLSSADASGAGEGTLQNAVAAITPGPAATTVPPMTYVGEYPDEFEPIPENVDPQLGDDHWGTRSHKVKGAKGQDVTGNYNDDVEDYENLKLSEEQAKELLKVFRNADGVRRLIDKYGGDPDEDTTRYWVRRIHADEDHAAPNTPWVTATLRADFYSPEGVRGLEMEVYRRKNDKGQLDNTPYVAQTQIAYLERGGSALSNRLGYRHDEDEEFAVAHDTLETIYYED